MALLVVTSDSFFQNQLNPLSTNPTKWSNTLKQFVGKLPTNCLSVFDHFVGLVLKGLSGYYTNHLTEFDFLKSSYVM